MSYELLLSPMNIGNVTIRNRVVMTAAEMGLGQANGKPTKRMMDYYEARAKGGAGLIIPGICRVNDMGATTSFTQLAMSHDYHIEPMRAFAERIHRHGAKLAIQLHHPGRQGYSTAINTLPMVIPVTDRFPKAIDSIFKATPTLFELEAKGICQPLQAPSACELSAHGAMRVRAMTRFEIRKTIRDFIEAAVRCQKAGVDIVELHCAHGYLLEQFLSPLTNQRTDEYGGSFENRLRFITEIIRGIQFRCGDEYPISVRLTVDECYDRIGEPGKGYDLAYGIEVAKYLQELGVAALNITCANYDTFNYWLEPTSFEPGWRAYMAKAVKDAVEIPVIAANFIRSPGQAERQLEDGTQDFIGTARSFFCDADWVNKVKEGREHEIRRCIGCLHCMSSFMTNARIGKPGECALNPELGREREVYERIPDGAGRLVVVAGGGVAGLTAAEQLLRRGFRVKLLEKSDKLGGQVITASECDLKAKLIWCIEDLAANVRTLGGEIVTGCEATAETISAMSPYAVVVATGGVPVKPRSIEGLDRENVCTAPELISGERVPPPGRVVVAGSGLTGLAAVEKLNDAGCTVTLIEMADEIAPGTWFQLVDDEMSRIKGHGTVMLTGKRLLSVEEGRCAVVDVKTGKKDYLEADVLVLALGVRPVNALAEELDGKVGRLCVVGDASGSGNIAHAVHSAYDTVLREIR